MPNDAIVRDKDNDKYGERACEGGGPDDLLGYGIRSAKNGVRCMDIRGKHELQPSPKGSHANKASGMVLYFVK